MPLCGDGKIPDLAGRGLRYWGASKYQTRGKELSQKNLARAPEFSWSDNSKAA